VDKPAGITSHDVVQRVRRAYRIRAVGHTGTLDPFATGLMVVLLGAATRLARFVESQPKTYLATARLGVTTDTDDATGAVIAEAAVPTLEESVVWGALNGFLGRQSQRPPAYSAKHVDGERSYRRARRGETVELPAVNVEVTSVELLGIDGTLVTFRVTVSAGTYVRAIARDFGQTLGVGAHLTALRRESIGRLRVQDAVPMDRLDGTMALLPAAAAVAHLPAREIEAADAVAIAHGRTIGAPDADSGTVALTSAGELVAIAEVAGGRYQPRVVLIAA
jgi:tRNA pseudouridine55 synthase